MINWRRVVSIMRKEWWHITRDRMSFILLLVSPVLVLITMGYAFSIDITDVSIGVLDQDLSPTDDPNEGDAPTGIRYGAAYLFERTDDVWEQTHYIKASNSGSADQFGFAVALDGNLAVVGALAESSDATGVNGDETSNGSADSGAAYVFEF